jgi:putative transposase
VTFVNDHKDRADGGQRWGVESICTVLTEHGVRIAPSTYYETMTRPPSARALRDEQLRPHIEQVFGDSGRAFGPRRVWRALNDAGITVARCTVERLMRDMSLRPRAGRA